MLPQRHHRFCEGHPYAGRGYVLRSLYDPENLESLKVFYSDHFVLPLPEGHRFPMVKYSMLRERVATAGICEPQEMCVPHPVSDEEILRAHDRDYLRHVVEGTLSRKEMRRIGFPWSERMVERSRRASGGTLGACLAAIIPGAQLIGLALGMEPKALGMRRHIASTEWVEERLEAVPA